MPVAQDTDASAHQAVRVEELGVVLVEPAGAGEGRGVGVVAAGHRPEDRRRVGDGAAVDADRVLAVGDRHHAGPRHQAEGRLDADDAARRGGADHRAVGLGAEGRGAQAGRGRGGRAGLRAARVAVEDVGVPHLAAPAAPAARRVEAAEVGPLRQARLAQEDRPGTAQLPERPGVPVGRAADQGERAGGGHHPVAAVDVVLDHDRNAVERPAHLAVLALLVTALGQAPGVRVGLDDRVEPRAVAVDLLDALQVHVDQVDGGELAGLHPRLELGDGRSLQLLVGADLLGDGAGGEPGQQAGEGRAGARGGGPVEEVAAAQAVAPGVVVSVRRFRRTIDGSVF